MKKLTFVILFMILGSANNYATNTPDYYKDKIQLIDLDHAKFSDFKSLVNTVNEKISQASLNNYDAVLLRSEIFSDIFTHPIAKSPALQLIKSACETAKRNNLKLFIDLDFAKNNPNNLQSESTKEIKSNINLLVSVCQIDGFYFSDINFNSESNYDLFEDIVVESAMVKPYLLIATSKNSVNNDSTKRTKLLENGIIDFVVNERPIFTIEYNKNANIDPNQKFLKSYLKRLTPYHFIKLDFSELLKTNSARNVHLPDGRTKEFGRDQSLNFISLAKGDSLKFSIGNTAYSYSKKDWAIPYNYLLHQDKSFSRSGEWIEFRKPFARIRSNDTYNLLCRTKFPSMAFINGEKVKIYKTGIFFKKIKLVEGLNKLRAEAVSSKGEKALYEDMVLYKKPDTSLEATKFGIDSTSIRPNENLVLLPSDLLTVKFNATKNQKALVEIVPSDKVFECFANDPNNVNSYVAAIPLNEFNKNQKYGIKVILKSADSTNQKSVEKISKNHFVIKDKNDFPFLATTEDNSLFTYTLAPIRLGAPLRIELPKDVILKSNGIFGNFYRVRLSETEEGYISNEYVKELPAGTIQPSYFINPITSFPSDTGDIVEIPYLENVPYDVYADPYSKRITINLYGVKTSSTWIIHKPNLKYIEEITWQQISKGTYRIYVNLKTDKIWGYDIKPHGKELIFRIKYPPVYHLKSPLPLKGIKISIEAGHGGSNSGAIGLSGVKEKDINLSLSKKIEKLFKSKGAQVLQVRDTDRDMSLTLKRDTVTNSDANIHISIHANASDPEDEFLGTSGTATFYNNPFWAKFSEFVFNRLIQLSLKPFGSVGSFNYRVIRMSDMPAILVEQAFLSNAEDEEKLTDDKFRDKMAQKIYEGLIDYLKYMKD
ncbi:MAG: N-acetylmuramoyl-L-alanine amidase [Bacteroidetes bacterium]|nr:N-acetylmuramoyl-L-alanine amidase [Bacteroidota bacterium]